MKCCMLCYGNNGMLWASDEWESNDICCKIPILWYHISMLSNAFVRDLNSMLSYAVYCQKYGWTDCTCIVVIFIVMPISLPVIYLQPIYRSEFCPLNFPLARYHFIIFSQINLNFFFVHFPQNCLFIILKGKRKEH